MTTPKVLVLRAPGTNCDHETKYAFELAGGQADRVHFESSAGESSLGRTIPNHVYPRWI